MAQEMDEALKEKLKSALWYSIGKITTEECSQLNTTATPQFIGTLTEMVWTQIENTAKDLETFSLHANRSTISTDDVLLITRRNEVLEEIMREFIDERRARRGVDDDDVSGTKGKGKGKGKGGRLSTGGGGGGRVEKSKSKSNEKKSGGKGKGKGK